MKLRGIESTHQPRYLYSRPSYIHAGNNAHYSDRTSKFSIHLPIFSYIHCNSRKETSSCHISGKGCAAVRIPTVSNHKSQILAIIGQGYVGLPLALAAVDGQGFHAPLEERQFVHLFADLDGQFAGGAED